MPRRPLVAGIVSLAMAAASPAQVGLVPVNGGDGSDGAFNPAMSTTLDTDQQVTFPTNLILANVGGLIGNPGGIIGINAGGGVVAPGTDATVFAQAVSLGPSLTITGVSNVVAVHLKF